MSLIVCTRPECQTTAGCRCNQAAAEIERLTRRLYEVDAQLTAEDHIHARECMALRAEKDAEIERLRAENVRLKSLIECHEFFAAEMRAALQAIADMGAGAQAMTNTYQPDTEAREDKAEIERLRAALEQAVDDFGEGHCVCEQTKQECIAALEPKP